MSDAKPQFTDEQLKCISTSVCFGGGSRHYQLIKDVLPIDHTWVDIVVPLSPFIETLKSEDGPWVIFASGDPLFFGIANTIKREIPEARLRVLPSQNSLQLLGHRLLVNYGEYHMVTLTGRPWVKFDQALLHNEAKISLLTDRRKTPDTIAQRMLGAGISNYRMTVGECLGGNDECIRSMSLQEASEATFRVPNCVFLDQTEVSTTPKGIDEAAFETLPGRPNMITKMPIRLATLAHMQLHNKRVLWDVGACSGSVSIDAKIHHSYLDVNTFEIRPECEGIITRNAQTYRVPGIVPLIGDFLSYDKQDLNLPDAVFLGGYGGKMHDVLDMIDDYILPRGIIAFNSVSQKSADNFKAWVEKSEYTLDCNTSITVAEFNPITILIAKKEN